MHAPLGFGTAEPDPASPGPRLGATPDARAEARARRAARWLAAATLLWGSACTLPSLASAPSRDRGPLARTERTDRMESTTAPTARTEPLASSTSADPAPPSAAAEPVTAAAEGAQVEPAAPVTAPSSPESAPELAALTDQLRILWRGEPLEVELAPASPDPASAAPDFDAPRRLLGDGLAKEWVLADLLLAEHDGAVVSAMLRSNGDRLAVPLDELRLATPRAERNGAPSTPLQSSAARDPESAAWWVSTAAQQDGEEPPKPASQGQGDGNPAQLPDRHSPLFAERESESLEGELQELEPLDGLGRPVVVRLRSANNHYHRVLLAPPAHLTARAVRLDAGTQLVARGVRTRDAKGTLLVAREIELAGRAVALRRADGVPRWTPVPEPVPQPAPEPEAPDAGSGPGPDPARDPGGSAGTDPAPNGAGPSSAVPGSGDVAAEPQVAGPPTPLAQDGRLSAVALLATRLELVAVEGGASERLAVSGLVLDLPSARIPYLALRPMDDRGESWFWVPWEALEWRDGFAYLALPAGAAELTPPRGGVDARTLLPSDQVLERARAFWLAD